MTASRRSVTPLKVGSNVIKCTLRMALPILILLSLRITWITADRRVMEKKECSQRDEEQRVIDETDGAEVCEEAWEV